MWKMRVAVIGGGISGLVSAYILAKNGVEVVLYEKEDHLGGHAKTVTCPNMVEWFESLAVDMQRLDMSFSVSLDQGRGWEWGGQNGLSSLFAQKKNLFNPSFWKMLREIFKFKDDVISYLEILENNMDIDRNETLGQFVTSHGYSELFQEAYLVPICSSIWSFPSEGVMSFSAYSILSFFRNHHLLQLFRSPQWLAIKGQSYYLVNKVREELESRGCRIRTRCEVHKIARNDEGCIVLSGEGSEEVYSGCILAVHAPDAVRLLAEQVTPDELRVLGSRDNKVCLTYWLNVLQNIGETSLPFLVIVNPENPPKHTLLKWSTGHPVPSVAASKALLELHHIQGKRGIWFSGAYQGYGFHEDELKAGISSTHGILGESCALLSNPKHMVMTQAELGFADAYVNGDCYFVDKDEACLEALLHKLAETSLVITTWYSSRCSFQLVLVFLQSNELFALFLGETMQYSCGIFKTKDEDLNSAQRRKIFTLIEKARIQKKHEVLGIGCGWGVFAIELVKQTGCKYTGITLSEEQLKFAEKKVADVGLQDHIKFLLCDYRQLPDTPKFDRIISCEMLEHVGHDNMNDFFGCCESILAEDGIFVLQFTSLPDERYEEHIRSSDFIKEYIFPGACIPSLSRVTSAMVAASRFCVEHLENIGSHYYRTLRSWRNNFLEKKSEILALGFDERFIRTWLYYFDYTAAGFKTRTIGNYQIVFSRPGNVAALGNQ
ncbi:hypothetical protein FEM48_Zijuj07G0095300 [Ziziphus jujuba var. spinosa]|uniref:Amine oxidase domain-containing protein n=1 Tax=Ziziphus jujuba var. spinosa TaxID=714518 RepID=A0A978V3V3_ZIZJJ|nr:hypothetical protein FEM48_Zijuj07G0095300 [Ziziphus jujuba var. spinosa]